MSVSSPVSLAAADELLDAVREACAPGVWSRGVELARGNAVVGERCDSDEIVMRVANQGGLVSPAVSLFPADVDWNCECKDPDDPCLHVAAAIIAVKQAIKHGQSPTTVGHDVVSERGVLRYAFEGRSGELVLHRHVVVQGDARPLIGSLAERMADGRGPQFIATKVDHQFEAVVGPFGGGAIAPKLMAKVLRALANQPDLTYDGQPVTIGSATSGICLRISSHGEEFVARLEQAPAVTEVFSNAAIREGRVLRAVAGHGMNERTFASLRRGRTFAPADVGELVGEILPKVRSNVTVIIDTDRLPGSVRLRPRLELATEREGDQLVALPRLVYGDPAVARVDGDRLTVFDPTTVPVRSAKVERLLLARLDELGLEPGVKRVLSAEEAITLAKVLDDIDPDVSASDDSAHQDFFEAGELEPHLEFGDNGDFELWFETDDEAVQGKPTRKRADAGAVLRAWERGDTLAPLLDGGFGRLPAGWLERFGDRVGDLLEAKREALFSDTEGGRRVPPFAALDLAELAESLEQTPPTDFSGLRAIVDDFAGVPEPMLPADLRADLRDYQRTGVAWLAFLQSMGLGGLLADDMGLGKTIQALCVIERPALVVAPTSVLHNWALEAARFRPGLSVDIYHGPDRKLRDDIDLTLTTYAILRLDVERLRERKWRVVVLDEAQAIKNPDSKVAQAAFALQADFRLCMTGTPVENRLLDLWSQFRFANRGLLAGRKRFLERYVRPIAAGSPGSAERLRARIGPFVLRRRKSEVAKELPPRTEVVLRCELEDDERRSYDAVRAATQQEVVSRLSGGQDVLQILEALLRLRQAACHPALLPGHERFSAKASSKVALLIETLVEVAAEGHKSLVFSQWTSLLDLVEPHLRAAELGFVRLDGSTRDRQAVVETFQASDGPPVMLLSLRAGGTGLNLTAADHVFLLDPWWNPAVEDQAADRAHRIGQDKPVIVHRLVARGTVEEGILVLQQRKRELAELTVGQADGITREDLVALLQ